MPLAEAFASTEGPTLHVDVDPARAVVKGEESHPLATAGVPNLSLLLGREDEVSDDTGSGADVGAHAPLVVERHGPLLALALSGDDDLAALERLGAGGNGNHVTSP